MEANQQEHLPIHVSSGEEDQSKEVLAEDLFSYEDTEIQIALVHDHSCYVNVQQCCLALGLNPRGQLQRIRRTPELDEHLAQLPIHTHAGVCKLRKIRFDRVPKAEIYSIKPEQSQCASEEPHGKRDSSPRIREALATRFAPNPISDYLSETGWESSFCRINSSETFQSRWRTAAS